MKKNIFFALTLMFGVGCTINLPVFADDNSEAPTSMSEEAIGSGLNTDGVQEPDSDDSASNPVDEANKNAAEECLENDCPDAENIEHEGTSGEPLVVCADENKVGCEESSSQEDNADEPSEEPELWPMWVSLGALGAMIILVIIINIAGSKRKK